MRERTHRNTSESTNARVLWWSLIEAAALVAMSVLQVRVCARVCVRERERERERERKKERKKEREERESGCAIQGEHRHQPS